MTRLLHWLDARIVPWAVLVLVALCVAAAGFHLAQGSALSALGGVLGALAFLAILRVWQLRR